MAKVGVKPYTKSGAKTIFQEGAVVEIEAEWKDADSLTGKYLSVIKRMTFEGHKSTAHVAGFRTVEEALEHDYRWSILAFKFAVIEDRTQAVYQQALDDGDDPEPPLNWMQMMEAANAWSI